jgi:hypothetical protein
MLHANKSTLSCHLPFSLHVSGSTFCFWLMAFTCWLMSSLLTPFKCSWFHMLHCFVGWLQQWRLIKRKDFIEIGILKTCFSFLPLRFLGVYINKPIKKNYHCANMAWVPKGFKSFPLSVLCAFYKQTVIVVFVMGTCCIYFKASCYC